MTRLGHRNSPRLTVGPSGGMVRHGSSFFLLSVVICSLHVTRMTASPAAPRRTSKRPQHSPEQSEGVGSGRQSEKRKERKKKKKEAGRGKGWGSDLLDPASRRCRSSQRLFSKRIPIFLLFFFFFAKYFVDWRSRIGVIVWTVGRRLIHHDDLYFVYLFN